MDRISDRRAFERNRPARKMGHAWTHQRPGADNHPYSGRRPLCGFDDPCADSGRDGMRRWGGVEGWVDSTNH
jgi:hypothetical protein